MAATMMAAATANAAVRRLRIRLLLGCCEAVRSGLRPSGLLRTPYWYHISASACKVGDLRYAEDRGGSADGDPWTRRRGACVDAATHDLRRGAHLGGLVLDG